MATKKKIKSVVTKKIGAGAREPVPQDSWGLMDYLVLAVDRTCRRMCWVGDCERASETYCEIKAWYENDRHGSGDVMIFIDANVTSPFVEIRQSPISRLVDMLLADDNPGWKTEREAACKMFARAVKLECAQVIKERKKKSLGRSRLSDPEVQHKQEVVRHANQMKADDPSRTWKEIARELDVPERTLRDLRHNTHCSQK